jgi:hypothetical protein
MQVPPRELAVRVVSSVRNGMGGLDRVFARRDIHRCVCIRSRHMELP